MDVDPIMLLGVYAGFSVCYFVLIFAAVLRQRREKERDPHKSQYLRFDFDLSFHTHTYTSSVVSLV